MADAPVREVERLYGLDLDEFITARDATSRRLREDGRRDAAAAVKALRKPSNAAWIVNRLSALHPGVVSRLLEAGQALREVQLRGGGEKLRDAIAAERGALERAMRNAEEIATHAGLASGTTLDRVRETLHLAALDPEVSRDVERGTLVREGRASGLLGSGDYVARARPRRRLQSPVRLSGRQRPHLRPARPRPRSGGRQPRQSGSRRPRGRSQPPARSWPMPSGS